MTAKNRTDIQSEVDSLLADNVTGDISPSDVRIVHETSKDSNLNLLESTTQIVAGLTNYTGGLQVSAAKVLPLADTVIVNLAADLPAPSAGEIQLADNTVYLLAGIITIADTIKVGTNSPITSHSKTHNELKYTGTGSMFKGSNKSFQCSNIGLRCATGTLNDWVDVSPLKESVIEYDQVIIHECDKIGLCTDIKQIRYFACVFSDIKTTGGTFAGNIGQVFSVDTDYVNNSATPVIDLGTVTADLIWHIDYQVDLVNASGSWISGLAGDANLNAGGTGQILVGLHTGPGTDLIGITTTAPNWNFQDINRVTNTRPDGLLSMQGNATATTNPGSGVSALIAGTWVVERTSQMTGTTAGRLTYNAGKDATLPITGSFTVVPVSGGSIDISVEASIDGTPVPNSKRTTSASSGNPSSITVPWQDVLSTAGFVEWEVTNENSGVNILVSSAISRVN